VLPGKSSRLAALAYRDFNGFAFFNIESADYRVPAIAAVTAYRIRPESASSSPSRTRRRPFELFAVPIGKVLNSRKRVSV